METNNELSPLVPLGAGIGIGGAAVWALVELWPVLLIVGGMALVLKGMQSQGNNDVKESESCKSGQTQN